MSAPDFTSFDAAVAEAEQTEPPAVTVRGRKFPLGQVSSMALMSFSRVAAKGVDSADIEGLAAMHRLLESALAPGTMPAFEDWCISEGIDDEELLTVVKQIITGAAGRPTKRPSSSSPGQPPTSTTSKDVSSPPEPVRPPAYRDDPRLAASELVPAERALQLLTG